jgi:hypothetical protein
VLLSCSVSEYVSVHWAAHNVSGATLFTIGVRWHLRIVISCLGSVCPPFLFNGYWRLAYLDWKNQGS